MATRRRRRRPDRVRALLDQRSPIPTDLAPMTLNCVHCGTRDWSLATHAISGPLPTTLCEVLAPPGSGRPALYVPDDAARHRRVRELDTSRRSRGSFRNTAPGERRTTQDPLRGRRTEIDAIMRALVGEGA